MTDATTSTYFDLYVQGLAYLNRVREVKPKAGSPFWSASVVALRGPTDDPKYTRFDCIVAGQQARDSVQRLQAAVEAKQKVLIGFTLSDPHAEAFVFQQGDKAGEPGAQLKARLLKVQWAKVDGEPFELETREAS